MMPPPMTTTWARPGSACAIPLRPPYELVRHLHVGEQALEGRAGEACGRCLEALHRPRPEVEVQVTVGMLDGTPERPAVPRHQAVQPCPRDPAAARPAIVSSDQRGQRLVVQAALPGHIAE